MRCDGAVELRRGALIEGGEAQHHRLAERDLIDVLGLDLDLDRQLVGLRHDQHDRVAGGDDAADRVRRRLEHDAVLRRADVGALELILGRHLALDVFADLAVGLAQLLGDVAGEFLIDLEDLQLDLGDLALGLGGIGDELSRARPAILASSRSSEVSRLSWTRFFCQRSRTPASSWSMKPISLALASCCAVSPVICSCNCLMRCCS